MLRNKCLDDFAHPRRHWHRVDDIAAAVERVRAAGGRADEPERKPDGLLAECADDQGATFRLWQPAGFAPAPSIIRTAASSRSQVETPSWTISPNAFRML